MRAYDEEEGAKISYEYVASDKSIKRAQVLKIGGITIYFHRNKFFILSIVFQNSKIP